MNFDPSIVDRNRVDVRPRAFLRITPKRFETTPLGMGFGETRFASPTRAFTSMYIAANLVTAIAETIVRDRFVGRVRRRLTEEEFEEWCVAEIHANAALSVVDLRGSALVQLGVQTDAARAKSHQSGRRFSERLYDHDASIDGILYASRLTGGRCIAVYDRAVAKLDARSVAPLLTQPGLVSALVALNVTVLRR